MVMLRIGNVYDRSLSIHHSNFLLHLGVVAGGLEEAGAAGPRVAEGELTMDLAVGAGTAAQTPGNVHDGGLINAVLLDGLHAQNNVHAVTAEAAGDAHGQVELVGDALEGLPLAGHGAGATEVEVDALGGVHHAGEKPGSPLS